ncbi:MAG TPA: DUF6588 family protein, partial [Bacteroidota bacterium]
MKLVRTSLLFVVVFITASAVSLAQNDISAQLTKLLDANATGYMEPFASALGADLNSGLYHSADLHSVLGFDIGLKVGYSTVPSDHRTFDFMLPNQIKFGVATLNAGTDYDQIVAGSPTFAGGKTGIPVVVKQSSPQVLLRGQTIFTTPGGFDYPHLPLIAPQAAIGLPFGIEVIGRFLPSTKVGDAGKVNFAGFGLRYDIDQFIPFCPVDLAVHFMTQKATLNDNGGKKVLSLSGTAFGGEVSKSLLLFTIYGGFQIESSNLT